MAEYTIRKSVAAMEEYSVESVAADIIVNANESNYPLPEPIAQAVGQCAAQFPFNRYPPLKSESLSQVIAEELGVGPECVCIGNGSSELLQVVCYAFGGAGKRIAIPYPSFSMYGEYVVLADSEPITYPLNVEGYVDPEAVIKFCAEEKPDLLIICNPNNPTGNYNSLANMEKILANVDCPVIMDEAYMEFADGKEIDPKDLRPLNKLWLVAGSTLSLLNKYHNFMVFRTFSKAYGLAGLRCGYGVGASALMRQLGKALLPYHVNAFTLMVAKAVYENKEMYKERLGLIRQERDKMAAYLKELGFKVWPSATNFLMLRPEGKLADSLTAYYGKNYTPALKPQVAAGKAVFKYLLGKSILVRDFTGHPVLTGGLRITVGLPEENKIILATITQLCTEAKL